MKDGTIVVLKEDLLNIDIKGLNSYDVMTKTECDRRVGIYASAGDEFIYSEEDHMFSGPGGNELRLAESWYEISNKRGIIKI